MAGWRERKQRAGKKTEGGKENKVERGGLK